MEIKDFSYGCRFTDEDFALFSEKQLSKMKLLSKEETSGIWYSYCDNEILPLSYFIKDIIAHKLPVLSNDCGWGDEEAERATKNLLETEMRDYIEGYINVCYDDENALKVSTRLFCDKWSDFCYPSDYLIIDLGDRALLYYEDMIYYLDKIENT